MQTINPVWHKKNPDDKENILTEKHFLEVLCTIDVYCNVNFWQILL